MKPDTSRAVEVILFIFYANSRVVFFVSSLVYNPTMISTSFITGTGFIKCIPITWCALLGICPANFVIEIEEVFVAKMAWGGACLAMSSKILLFSTKSSLAA